MPSTHIKRLDIAIESSYMNRDATGEPSTAGLSWMPCEFADASQVVAFGDTQTLEYNASAGGFGVNPGEALIDPISDLPVKRGSISIDFFLRGGLTDNKKGLLAVLCSRLQNQIQSAAISGGMSINSSSVETPAIVGFGQFLAYTRENDENRISYGISRTTTSSTSPNVTPSPDADGPYTGTVCSPTTGTTKISTYSIPGEGGDPISYGTGTFALRLTGDDWQQIAFGCAMTALTLTADGDGRAIKLSATIDAPYIEDIDPSAIVYPNFPTVTDGPILHSLGSPARIEDWATDEVLDGLGGGPCIASWSISLSWTTAGAACGSYWSGRAPLEATALEATVDLTIGSLPGDTRGFFFDAWKGQHQLSVSLPFGGCFSPSTGNPFGGAIILPAAVVADGAFLNPDLSGDAVQTTVSLRLTPFNISAGKTLPLFVLGVI